MNARERAAFTSYVDTHAPELMRSAYLLAGDHPGAERRLQTALARLRLAWRRVQDPADADAFIRRSLVDGLAGRGGAATADTADQNPLWSAFSTLPLRSRAALAWRYHDGLPDADVAAALGCPPSSASRQIDAALHALGSSREPEFEQRLTGVLRSAAAAARPLPDPLPSVQISAGRLHRRRLALCGAALAVAVAGAALVIPLLAKNTSPAVAIERGAPPVSIARAGGSLPAASAAPLGAAVAVYYPAAAGGQVFREFRRTTSRDRLRAAIELALAAPLDPDYRAPWPAGTVLRTLTGAGADLAIDLSGGVPAAGSPVDACRQLASTATAADPSIERVSVSVAGRSLATCDGRSATLAPVQISTYNEGDGVRRRFSFGGEASGVAPVAWSVTDSAGTVLRVGTSAVRGHSGGRGLWQAIVVLDGAKPGDVVQLRAGPAAGDAGVGTLDSKTVRIVR